MKKNLLLSLAAGISMSLAFPPLQSGFLAYVTLVPFFFLLENKTFGESFKWGYITGFFHCATMLYWINWVTVVGGVAAILYLPLYFSLFALVFHFLRSRIGDKVIFFAPFLWVGMEYLRSLSEFGFPWTTLGYSQSYYTVLIQYASITSVFGVSFWIVLINVLVYQLIKKRKNHKAVVIYALSILLLFILPLLYGKMVMREIIPSDPSLRVALVQGNIDPREKWNNDSRDVSFDTYERLTYEIAKENPDCIIWPETATPCYLRYQGSYLQRVRDQIDSLGIPLITGTPDFFYQKDGSYKTYNSVFLLLPNDISIQYYAKIKLVPFGERVPYQDAFPFIYIKTLLDYLELGQGDWSVGQKETVFQLPMKQNDGISEIESAELKKIRNSELKFSVAICYESVFNDFVRKFVAKGAEFLVVITNDAWFGNTSAPHQHAQMAVFRAIENRIAIARCANTGISGFIDPFGRMYNTTKLFTEAAVVDSVPLRNTETFYTRHGNIFTVVVSAIALCVTFTVYIAKKINDIHAKQSLRKK